jgi:hypothetical protein
MDSGVDYNFITLSKVAKLQLLTITKDILAYIFSIIYLKYKITISYKTDYLKLIIAGCTKTLKANLFKLNNCNVMLGYPWL